MERLAVIGGLIVAAMFALGALTPSLWDEVSVHVDTDSGWEQAEPVPADQITTLAETAFAGSQLIVSDAAVRLEIVPEDRADFAIAIDNAGPLATPIVTTEAGAVRIDGRLGAGVSCRHDGSVVVHGRGSVRRDAMPVVRVRAPRTLAVETVGANQLTIADALNLRLVVRGCGDAVLGDVMESLDLTVGGAGDVKAGRAGQAQLDLSGAGDVALAAVSRGLQGSIAGAGALSVEEARGEVSLTVTGSGEARIAGGSLSRFDGSVAGSGDIVVDAPVEGPAIARVSGSGDVTLNGVVETLNATVEGSGEVEVASVRGQQTRIVRGSGTIEVHDGPSPPTPPTPPTTATRPTPATPASPPSPALPPAPPQAP